MVKVLFICTSEVLPDWFSIRPPSTGSGSLLPSWRIRWTRSPDSASASIRPISTITTIQVGSFWWMPSPATWFNQCRRNLFNHAAAIQIWPLAVTCRVTWSFSAHSPSSDSTWTYQPASIGLILMEDRFWLLLARHRRHRRSSHHKFVISLLAALMALSSSWQSDPVYKKKQKQKKPEKKMFQVDCWSVNRCWLHTGGRRQLPAVPEVTFHRRGQQRFQQIGHQLHRDPLEQATDPVPPFQTQRCGNSRRLIIISLTYPVL